MSSIEQLRAGGASIRRIAILLGISRNTVRRYLRRAHCPRKPPVWRGRAIELFSACRNGAEVARKLRDEGFAISTRSVQRVVQPARFVEPRHFDATG